MNKQTAAGHLCMFAANSAFGLLSPVAKIVMMGGIITPFIMTELRVTGAMILFWLASFVVRHEHVPHQDLFKFFFASLFAITLNQGTFIFGVGLTTPGDASILTTSMPMWAMILAAIILKDPITGRKVLGIAAGAGGALMLILSSESFKGADPQVQGSILGDVLVTCAQLSFAFYVVRFKSLVSRYSLITVMKWMFTFAFITTMPFVAGDLARVPWPELELSAVGGIVYVVVVATFLAYIFLVVGQKSLKPTVVGMYNYVQPIVACLTAVYLGLDHFTPLKGAAVLLIFVGVYMVTHSRSREEIEAYHAKQAAEAAAAQAAAKQDSAAAEDKG